ncbi:hypothetical protein ACJ73_04155 [Blastomyces percursus]|uniref:Uncharacterized protein n=1 Tax=Blastomyces percursus TaxID=1658174 RepID=A0A1J9R7M3_9EURO|nr:hypothetical protein ACJ73_04155 [Blastomyces percursus]
MSDARIRDFAALGGQQQGVKRKRSYAEEDLAPKEDKQGPNARRRRFSTFREQTPDEDLLKDIDTFLDALECRRKEASARGDTGTPYQLNLLVTFTQSWREAYLARPGLDWSGFPTIRAPRRFQGLPQGVDGGKDNDYQQTTSTSYSSNRLLSTLSDKGYNEPDLLDAIAEWAATVVL